jgi:hypothetical protein
VSDPLESLDRRGAYQRLAHDAGTPRFFTSGVGRIWALASASTDSSGLIWTLSDPINAYAAPTPLDFVHFFEAHLNAIRSFLFFLSDPKKITYT